MKQLGKAAIVGAFVAFGSAAGAATLDFVAAAAGNERGAEGETLVFGDISVTLSSSSTAAAAGTTGSVQAYLDDLSAGKPAGLGVCSNTVPDATTGDNDCSPSSDDNITVGESVTLTFADAIAELSGWVFYNANHNTLATSTKTLEVLLDGVSIGATTFASLVGGSPLTGSFTTLTLAYGGANPDQFYLGSVNAIKDPGGPVVPVPASLPLLLAGVGAIAYASRRKARG